MTDDRLKPLALLAGAAVLGPVLIGLAAGLSALGYLTVAALLLVGVAVGGWFWMRTPARPHLYPDLPDPRPQVPVRQDRRVVGPVEIPSDTADYTFRFSATVNWTGGEAVAHGDPAALAGEVVVERAAELSAGYSIADRDRAGTRLAATLGGHQTGGRGRMTVWATDVVLDVDEDDGKRIRELSRLRKDVQLWEHNRDHEIAHRRYLHDEVLRTPGSTLVWWLARHEEKVGEAVAQIDTFGRLSDAAQDRAPIADPDPDGTPWLGDPGELRTGPDVDSAFLQARGLVLRHAPEYGSDRQRMTADDIARYLDPEDARKLRAEFGVPPLDEPEPDPPRQPDDEAVEDRWEPDEEPPAAPMPGMPPWQRPDPSEEDRPPY
ncbi:hypothetical protein [Pseudonocardia sp. HH130630-07]|uniref:hypothetical protein n=1 Tax=Pseudonocardia sp. HH130630-07 TaxID=1690815 RepID=UPI0008152F5A|nr:hypothetical protein [Pseudonocardia sp. HH130630-07]ANY08719.1 hypothetical protein AFB00_23375 [Pseudonocardia sp. HH130630-07]